jgi:hypothetical protein
MIPERWLARRVTPPSQLTRPTLSVLVLHIEQSSQPIAGDSVGEHGDVRGHPSIAQFIKGGADVCGDGRIWKLTTKLLLEPRGGLINSGLEIVLVAEHWRNLSIPPSVRPLARRRNAPRGKRPRLAAPHRVYSRRYARSSGTSALSLSDQPEVLRAANWLTCPTQAHARHCI